jgi:hypothetical protein
MYEGGWCLGIWGGAPYILPYLGSTDRILRCFTVEAGGKEVGRRLSEDLVWGYGYLSRGATTHQPKSPSLSYWPGSSHHKHSLHHQHHNSTTQKGKAAQCSVATNNDNLHSMNRVLNTIYSSNPFNSISRMHRLVSGLILNIRSILIPLMELEGNPAPPEPSRDIKRVRFPPLQYPGLHL